VEDKEDAYKSLKNLIYVLALIRCD